MSAPGPFPAALRLVYVVDLEGAADAPRLEAALSGGVTCLWLRDPAANGRQLYDAAGTLVLRARRAGAAVLVGDRADIALAAGADGVQLGRRAPPARTVRPWYPGWMGVSCHAEAEVRAAQDAQADHIVLSPVFGVPLKGPPLGVQGLTVLARGARVPVVALGGIDPANVTALRALGIAGVAAVRAIRDADDPAEAARGLVLSVTSP